MADLGDVVDHEDVRLNGHDALIKLNVHAPIFLVSEDELVDRLQVVAENFAATLSPIITVAESDDPQVLGGLGR